MNRRSLIQTGITALLGYAVPPRISYAHQQRVPDAWEIVYRSCIVRLGTNWNWYENNAHGSAGVNMVRIDPHTHDLIVETDFDNATEKILSARANIDHQLTGKFIFVGASGGGDVTRYAMRSCVAHPGYPVGTQIRPNAGFFNSNLDNLWIEQISMRPKR